MLNKKKPRSLETPPPNYVAGLARGASGFTTRSDLGPARMAADPPPNAGGRANPIGYVPGKGRGATSFSGGDMEGDNERDNFGTNLADDEVGLFTGVAFDEDDDEADRMYNAIDDRMDNRRKNRREKLLQQTVAKIQQERPKISQMFVDAKAPLASISFEQWEALSDPGDVSHSNKRAKFDRYTPVPNSLLEQAQKESQTYTALDRRQQMYGGATPLGGLITPATSVTPFQDLTKVGEVKQTIMAAKLAAASDSVTGQTSVNPKGYMTDLNSRKVSTAAEIGDLEHARKLLESVVTANPSHAPGWIACARLEETDGKIVRARKIIQQGCEACPKSEDVWLEAARLNNPDEARTILAEAVRYIPNSVNIWQAAAKLETDPKRQKRVLRKALESIPNSALLWKMAVSLEKPEDARIMLNHAVECIPSSVEMWLALAKLETYENAKKVLNKARSTIPTEKAIWVTAAQLEEANGNEQGVHKLIRKAVKSLIAHGVQIDREQWINEAETCEKSGFPVTCQAIVTETIGLNIEEEDRKSTWCEDADACLSRNSLQTARAIYVHATATFPTKQSLWLRMAQLERKYGDAKSLESVLAKSVRFCVKSETLWLMYAKHKWQSGDIQGAREVLKDARSLHENEKIWLAAVKLEKETGEYENARSLLKLARSQAKTEQIWMKSALLEREMGHDDEEYNLITQASQKYPYFFKFYLMLGQYYERKGKIEEARETYRNGVKSCPHSIPIWLSMIRLEEKTNGIGRARAVMEKAKLKNPKCPELWLESVRMENRGGESRIAFNILAKGLQDCPKSGLLWAEAIEMESLPAKKSRSADALKRCDQAPQELHYVMLAVAKLFWQNRQIPKARDWFARVLNLNPDYGDAWASALKFESQFGTPEQQQEIINRCVLAEPHHGELWISVSKDTNNTRLKVEDILKLASQKVSVEAI
eukprot:TRINITY_DN1956_c0_g9_i1.p1 TRINITY_DN1956_c0_g9~~TRINITY_DN1956_c0_g9_i1.p1  ORF type:complete len:938 (+),score=262.31 TRINITY_DN1956_c0_g9_i1:50-2863(+)